MNQEQETTLLSGVAGIQEAVGTIKDDIADIKKNGCPKGYINNGKIKLNALGIWINRWILGLILAGVIGLAFFVIRTSISG